VSYRGFTDVCDDYSWGGGSGSGGCLRSHYSYYNAQWMQMTGTVSESCLRVADAAQQGSRVTFAPGVLSYVETVRTLSTAP